jgi:hypothetical protein
MQSLPGRHRHPALRAGNRRSLPRNTHLTGNHLLSTLMTEDLDNILLREAMESELHGLPVFFDGQEDGLIHFGVILKEHIQTIEIEHLEWLLERVGERIRQSQNPILKHLQDFLKGIVIDPAVVRNE